MKKFEKVCNVIKEQLAKNVVDDNLPKDVSDKNLLRLAIQAEYDAINLYEQMAETTSDKKIKEVMLDVAKEEKVHVEEFKSLLQSRDKEQEQAVDTAADELKEK